VYRPVCLFTPNFRWYSLRLPTEDGRAELTWWLVTYRDGLPVCRRSPIQVLTGPSIASTTHLQFFFNQPIFQHYSSISQIPQQWTFTSCRSNTFSRSDAFYVTQTTAQKHWRDNTINTKHNNIIIIICRCKIQARLLLNYIYQLLEGMNDHIIQTDIISLKLKDHLTK